SLKTSIKTITNLSDTNCLEIQGASLQSAPLKNVEKQNAKLNLGMFDVVIDTAKGLMPLFSFF
ncbi:hypothetical protein M8T97_21200, partial [Enterobacter hormaechei]|nr:hypothetical protein [Enterobacter hormaechei]